MTIVHQVMLVDVGGLEFEVLQGKLHLAAFPTIPNNASQKNVMMLLYSVRNIINIKYPYWDW